MSYTTYDYSPLRVNGNTPSGVVVNGTPCYRMRLNDSVDLIHKDDHYENTVTMNISVTCRVDSYYYEWTTCSSTDIDQHIFIRDVKLHASIASSVGDYNFNIFDIYDASVGLYHNNANHPLFVSNLFSDTFSSGEISVPGTYTDYNDDSGGSIGLSLIMGTKLSGTGPLYTLIGPFTFERAIETFWDRMINIPANYNGIVTFTTTSYAMRVHKCAWTERRY